MNRNVPVSIVARVGVQVPPISMAGPFYQGLEARVSAQVTWDKTKLVEMGGLKGEKLGGWGWVASKSFDCWKES